MWNQGYEYGMMGYGDYGILHSIFSLVWIVVLVAIIFTAVRFLRGGKHGHWHMHNSALDILKERYAKGEIDRAEFEEKKKDLS